MGLADMKAKVANSLQEITEAQAAFGIAMDEGSPALGAGIDKLREANERLASVSDSLDESTGLVSQVIDDVEQLRETLSAKIEEAQDKLNAAIEFAQQYSDGLGGGGGY